MWVNELWLEKAELVSLSVSVLAQRQQYSVPVSCLPFLNPDQIWPFLLLTTAESSGQFLQILPNRKVKFSCCFDLLHLHCLLMAFIIALSVQSSWVWWARNPDCHIAVEGHNPLCLLMIFSAHTWSLNVLKYFVRLWRSSCQKVLPISEFLCFIARLFSCA